MAVREQLLQRLQDIQTDLENLEQEAQEAVKGSKESFRDMGRFVRARSEHVEGQILSQTMMLQQQLQRDVSELERNIAELDTRPQNPNDNQLLERFGFRIQTGPLSYFEEVTRAVSALRENLQLTLEDGMEAVLRALREDGVLRLPAEPRTREDFLQYFTQITLNPFTAHIRLKLSDEKRAEVISAHRSRPGHQDRFSDLCQVLSRESLTGRCYWEVEWSGRWVFIAVSYSDIKRKGDSDEIGFGNNDKSWALECNRDTNNSFWFKSVRSPVSGPVSSRIGVYLDHSAGVLSFYSVDGNTMRLLHRHRETDFNWPLYAGIRLNGSFYGASAEFLDPE